MFMGTYISAKVPSKVFAANEPLAGVGEVVDRGVDGHGLRGG